MSKILSKDSCNTVTSTNKNDYNLETFIGMWSNWTEKEEQVFQEGILDKSSYFNRPIPCTEHPALKIEYGRENTSKQ